MFSGRKVDAATLDELEDILIMADLGVATAGRLRSDLERKRIDSDADGDDVRRILADVVTDILTPVARPLSDLTSPPGPSCHCHCRGQWNGQDHHHRKTRRAIY